MCYCKFCLILLLHACKADSSHRRERNTNILNATFLTGLSKNTSSGVSSISDPIGRRKIRGRGRLWKSQMISGILAVRLVTMLIMMSRLATTAITMSRGNNWYDFLLCNFIKKRSEKKEQKQGFFSSYFRIFTN